MTAAMIRLPDKVPDKVPGIRLCGDLDSGEGITAFTISPNDGWVVYRVNEINPALEELFSTPPDGTAASVRISRADVSHGSVGEFSVSPNSQRVVYRARYESNNGYHIYSTAIDGSNGGGTVTQLDEANDVWASVDPAGPAGCSPCAPGFVISPDSSTVLYRSDQNTDGSYQIHSVPIDGPSSLSITLTPPEGTFSTMLAIGGIFLVYRSPSSEQLFAVPIDGSALPIQVTPGNPAETLRAGWRVSPEGSGGAGSRVAYVVSNTSTSAETLYSVGLPFAGGSPHRLSHDPLSTSNGPNTNIKDFLWSLDGSNVFFTADPNVDGLFDLYRSPADGSYPPLALTDVAASSSSSGGVRSFRVSPDGSVVAYVADATALGTLELFAVPSKGPVSSTVKISGTMNAGRGVTAGTIQFTPDSSRVAYETTLGDPVQEIAFWVALSVGGSAPTHLGSLAGSPFGPPGELKLGASSRFGIYLGQQNEICAVGLVTGVPFSDSNNKLNYPISWPSVIIQAYRYAIMGNDQRVVYIAARGHNDFGGIFSVAIPRWVEHDRPPPKKHHHPHSPAA